MRFAWGTDDTNAIQDAWKATWDEENKRVYRLIFPTGTYCVTSLKSSSKIVIEQNGICLVLI